MTSEEKLQAIAALLAEGEVMTGFELRTVINQYYPHPGMAADLVGCGAETRVWHDLERVQAAIARGNRIKEILASIPLKKR